MITIFEFGDIIPQEDRTDGIVGRRDEMIEKYIHTEDGDNDLRKLKWTEEMINELQVMVVRSGGGGNYVTSIEKLNKTLEKLGHIKASENRIPNTSILVKYVCSDFYTDPKGMIEEKLDWMKDNDRITAYKYVGKGDDPYWNNLKKRQYIFMIDTTLSMRFFKLNIHIHTSSFQIFIDDKTV